MRADGYPPNFISFVYESWKELYEVIGVLALKFFMGGCFRGENPVCNVGLPSSLNFLLNIPKIALKWEFGCYICSTLKVSKRFFSTMTV